MQVKVIYCSNYNGCHLTIDDEYVEEYKDKKAEKVCDTVINFACNRCNDDGEFYGDIDDVEEVAIKAVHKVYGPDVEVIFEEDSLST